MASYLLAWNPDRWNWDDLAGFVAAFNRGEVSADRWSCGNNKSIKTGDEVWLIRLRREPRGIFGHGIVTTPSYEAPHWDDPKKVGQYVEYQLHSITNPETDPIIPRARLNDPPFQKMHWDTQSSGVRIPDDVALALKEEWARVHAGTGFSLPEEVVAPGLYTEGARRIVTVNSYERNARARNACIAHYGTRCSVCELTLSDIYGPAGDGLIHVHHLVSLAKIGKAYQLDPIKDLRPVCPNCHAIIHAREPHYSIDEVKKMRQAEQSLAAESR
jgi:5-methylcytosine-specific restriction protein A